MTNFNNKPFVEVREPFDVWSGWEHICTRLNEVINHIQKQHIVIVIETYQGVLDDELIQQLKKGLQFDKWIHAGDAMKSEQDIRQLVFPEVTDDRIFGYMTRLHMKDFFARERVEHIQNQLRKQAGVTIIYGVGASLIPENYHLLVYADMARWEIQQRMRRHQVDNIGVHNRAIDDWMLLYKQGFFVDWRVCDELKKELYDKWDFVLDTNQPANPKMVRGEGLLKGLEEAVHRPFSVVPFFDPGPWGGQWMKEKCNLDEKASNYAWCFNGVPEENSLLLKYGDVLFETPSINLVFRYPEELLGGPVYARFGAEFPIRFDFLDTVNGGNLSLQVHPMTDYIREYFGMPYTQDESYYMMDAKEDACVYLGLKNEVNPSKMIDELQNARQSGTFNAEQYVAKWPVKKHDHVLIPAGTVHCSGKNAMVLEISATPYIFTFKLWDWGRVGLDGRPRPINIDHGKANIQWNRTEEFTRRELINQVEKVGEGDGWTEERTGLHKTEFIETRRHWFTKSVLHRRFDSVDVICLVAGEEAVVESPDKMFEPFVVHYAETWIMPAQLGTYTIRPGDNHAGQQCATLKAFVRHG